MIQQWAIQIRGSPSISVHFRAIYPFHRIAHWLRALVVICIYLMICWSSSNELYHEMTGWHGPIIGYSRVSLISFCMTNDQIDTNFMIEPERYEIK